MKKPLSNYHFILICLELGDSDLKIIGIFNSSLIYCFHLSNLHILKEQLYGLLMTKKHLGNALIGTLIHLRIKKNKLLNYAIPVVKPYFFVIT